VSGIKLRFAALITVAVDQQHGEESCWSAFVHEVIMSNGKDHHE
jgi:hypothetical protein